ncbi:MAG: hypothetical protein NW220_04450 [Leptolyngbyaceae cyanobacterium bins.349]|nr:hypothetical protein [Leptolyngbyaceae cyanobacterium bins.349]
MKARIDKKQSVDADPISTNHPNFDFELWIKQVRPQLLASVQKRGVR